MAKLLNDHEFQRFSELQQKQASFTITSGEADELRDIVARAQKKRDDRAAAMQAIEAHIRQFDITPDDRAVTHNGVFRIRRVPIIYFPYVYKAGEK